MWEGSQGRVLEKETGKIGKAPWALNAKLLETLNFPHAFCWGSTQRGTEVGETRMVINGRGAVRTD